LASEGPSAATSEMASRISGNAIIASITRATGVSRRLKKPATSPSVTPSSEDTITTAKPTSSDTRPANMARLRTSRPNSSVPNQ
jgi:hypothetical protein